MLRMRVVRLPHVLHCMARKACLTFARRSSILRPAKYLTYLVLDPSPDFTILNSQYSPLHQYARTQHHLRVVSGRLGRSLEILSRHLQHPQVVWYRQWKLNAIHTSAGSPPCKLLASPRPSLNPYSTLLMPLGAFFLPCVKSTRHCNTIPCTLLMTDCPLS